MIPVVACAFVAGLLVTYVKGSVEIDVFVVLLTAMGGMLGYLLGVLVGELFPTKIGLLKQTIYLVSTKKQPFIDKSSHTNWLYAGNNIRIPVTTTYTNNGFAIVYTYIHQGEEVEDVVFYDWQIHPLQSGEMRIEICEQQFTHLWMYLLAFTGDDIYHFYLPPTADESTEE